MPKLIKQIHDLFNIAIDKGVTEYIPNSKVDDIIDQEVQKLSGTF